LQEAQDTAEGRSCFFDALLNGIWSEQHKSNIGPGPWLSALFLFDTGRDVHHYVGLQVKNYKKIRSTQVKRVAVSIFLGMLLLSSIYSGLDAAGGSRLGLVQNDPGAVGDIDASGVVGTAYTYFVHLPVFYQQYVVPTWKQIGLEGIPVRSLAVSPDGTLYAGTYQRGLHLSTDAGAIWTAVDDGIVTSATVSNIVLDPFDPSTVYVTSMQGYPYFFISQDAGESWHPGGGISHPPSRLAVDPNMPERLFVDDFPLDSVPGRIYRSMDGGTSWVTVFADQTIVPVRIVVSSATSGTVFISSARGLHRSTDGGTGWQQPAGGLPDACRMLLYRAWRYI
jgi:hypothetical protein